jgi:hypothetical protein
VPDGLDELMGPLLAALARHHRVLFVGPSEFNPPPVHGGPVFRIPGTRPAHVGSAAEALLRDGGRGLAVFKDFADLLPPGVGGVVLLSQAVDVALPVLRCRRDAAGWWLRTDQSEVRAEVAAEGLERTG